MGTGCIFGFLSEEGFRSVRAVRSRFEDCGVGPLGV